jgi:hypothetical protein
MYPPLRLILVWDTLAGHRSHTITTWLFAHGIMPLSTPMGGSWLTMAESRQRIIVGRALSGQHPHTPEQIIAWVEQTVRGWNQHPTPFVWNGKRRRRRERAHLRRLAASGAALLHARSLPDDPLVGKLYQSCNKVALEVLKNTLSTYGHSLSLRMICNLDFTKKRSDMQR